MFARHIEDPTPVVLPQHLIHRIELFRLREMADVASVNDKFGGHLQPLNLVQGRFERANHIGIGFFLETDMAVANLNKVELALRDAARTMAHKVAESVRLQDAAGHSPEYAGSGPGHTFEKSAPIYAIVLRLALCNFLVACVVGHERAPSFCV